MSRAKELFDAALTLAEKRRGGWDDWIAGEVVAVEDYELAPTMVNADLLPLSWEWRWGDYTFEAPADEQGRPVLTAELLDWLDPT